MSAFLLFSGLLLVAALYAQRKLPNAGEIADHLSWWVLYIALPALVLELVPKLRFDPHLWYLVASQWLGTAVSFAVLLPISRHLHWSRPRTAAVLLMAAFSNTAFIGIPMVGALRGDAALPLVPIADQVGCFVAVSTFGAAIVAAFNGSSVGARDLALNVVRFPPFPAMVLAVIVGQLGGWPELVDSTLHRISSTLAPLAMFSVGLRLRLLPVPGQRSAMTITLAWKLLLLPLFTWSVGLALGIHGLPLTVSVLETAMAPMFTTAIIARANNFDPDFTDTTLSVGLVLSFLTVPAWSLLLP